MAETRERGSPSDLKADAERKCETDPTPKTWPRSRMRGGNDQSRTAHELPTPQHRDTATAPALHELRD
jgi:hypothetical protein